jgi:hypothetical protein
MNDEHFLVRNVHNKLEFKEGPGFQRRNESTMKIIHQTHDTLGLNNFDWTYINTGDRSIGSFYDGKRVLSYSSNTNKYEHVIPDFVFDCWREVHINDYSSTVQQIIQNGNKKPETNLLGWRGAITHENRLPLLEFKNSRKYDILTHNWNESSTYISIPDSVKKWRYLIDVEGNGFSARIKLFLFSKRVLFLQERPYKEWFHSMLIPWFHYVPVNRNLDNLESHLNIIRNDSKLEDFIRHNAYNFAIRNLNVSNALERWKYVLEQPLICPI